MSEDPEPAENTSGGVEGGGRGATFEPNPDPDSRAEAVIDRLGQRY